MAQVSPIVLKIKLFLVLQINFVSNPLVKVFPSSSTKDSLSPIVKDSSSTIVNDRSSPIIKNR